MSGRAERIDQRIVQGRGRTHLAPPGSRGGAIVRLGQLVIVLLTSSRP